MTEKTKTPMIAKTGVPAVDRWNDIVREAYTVDEAPDAREVLEASDEEIERQLREAGVDLTECDAKADTTYEAMVAKLAEGTSAGSPRRGPQEGAARSVDDGNEDMGGQDEAWVASTAKPSTTRVPPRRSRMVWLAWAVAAATATGGAAYVAAHAPHHDVETPKDDVPVVHPPEVPPPVLSAAPPPLPVAPSPSPVEEKGFKAPH
jgi:uncharacterized Ntn-hydrolase superfamily protein